MTITHIKYDKYIKYNLHFCDSMEMVKYKLLVAQSGVSKVIKLNIMVAAYYSSILKYSVSVNV